MKKIQCLIDNIICLKKYKQCRRHKIPVKAAINIAQAAIPLQKTRLKRRVTYKNRSAILNQDF